MNILDAHLNNIPIPVSKVVEPQKKEEVKSQKDIISNKQNYKTIATVAGVATLAVVFAGIGLKNKPKKLQDIIFKNGKALLSTNGQDFSGKVKDVLKNGDTVILEYKDGIIKKSKRLGSVNKKKVYEYSGFDKIVRIFSEGKETSVNITKKINDTKKLVIENARKKAEARAELQRRLVEKDLLTQKAKEAQNEFNAQFDKMLSHKSAESSAKVIEAGCKRREELSQMAYNAPFEVKLSNKNAKESAEVFEESIKTEVRNRQISENLAKQKAEAAQELFNKPFDDMLSHKSASKSAEVLKKDVHKRKKSTLSDYYNDDGSVERIVQDKTSRLVEQIDEKGNVLSREVYQTVISPDGLQTNVSNTTKFSDNAKFSIGSSSTSRYNEIATTKHYVKDEKGKYTAVKRTKKTIKNRSITQYKEVMQLENGNSKTVVDDMYERTTKTTIRDKKGNIISESVKEWDDSAKGAGSTPPPEEMKLLADWYIHYLKLCKKYGVPVRPCGIEGGAGSHYFELCMLDTDPEKYYQYMELQRYRARYDENARLSYFLSKNQTCNSEVIENLLEMLKNGTLSIDDIMMIIDDFDAPIPYNIKQILKSLYNNDISREAAIEKIKMDSLDDVCEEVTNCYQSYHHQQRVHVYA